MTYMKVSKPVFNIAWPWPTAVLLSACYATWLLLVINHAALGWLWHVPAALLITLHSSLQHELLHGHLARNRRTNELLALPALGLFIPYRRFRDLHLAHHRDENLTDPYDDPESWYLSDKAWAQTPAPLRMLRKINTCLLGRILIGPALALYGFWRADLAAIRRGDSQVAKAWLAHLPAIMLVIIILQMNDVSLLDYVFLVALPGMSMLMIRTFIEHRAVEPVDARTAVVEAGWFMSLLFLNNNLHAVHHRSPATPWYALPALWRASRTRVLTEIDGNHYPDGYAEVCRRWLLSPREPIVTPLASRRDQ